MKQIHINGKSLSRLGLGCMGMSWAYGPSDAHECLKVLDRALELGVNHWDTADLYGAGANEELLSHRVVKARDKVFIATKFGNVVDRSLTSHQDQVAADAPWIVDGTPEYIHKSIDISLGKLGLNEVDLYYQHRVDPLVPIEESVGAMAELVKEGKVKALGLSEASVETIRRAHAVHPIAAVQSELSLWTRDYLQGVVPLCAELGIKFVAYSPLGRGFLTGKYTSAESFSADDFRASSPRFVDGNLYANMEIVNIVKSIAEAKGVASGQIALAWVLAQGEHVITIPGTKRVPYLEENAAADQVELNLKELAELNAIQPPQGERYSELAMAYLNK